MFSLSWNEIVFRSESVDDSRIHLLMEAVKLQQIDKDYRNHLQAFLNYSVKAQKKIGRNKTRPIFTKFQKFYDYEKELEKARGTVKSRFAEASKFLRGGKTRG